MKAISEISGMFGYKVVLLRSRNGKMRVEISGNIDCEINDAKLQYCSVSKSEVEDCTFNGKIELQALISNVRDKFQYKYN